MKTQAAKPTAKKPTAKKSAIDSVDAQAGAIAIAITVQTRKASAKSCAPLRAAMLATGEDVGVELLARLPTTTIAFKHFASQANSTAQLFAWFDDNQPRLTRLTKDGKLLLNMSGAYVSAFNIVHDKDTDGPLKGFPFYKKFSNALQQWAKHNGGVEKRASGSITDAIAAYLDKKEKEDSQALADSIVAWVLQNEGVLQRILDSKAV